MNFSLGNRRDANLKKQSIIYNTILNNQRNTMLALQQRQNNAVVAPAPAPAPVHIPAPAPVHIPAPMPVHAPSTNNKLPKKGFNVILSKLNQ